MTPYEFRDGMIICSRSRRTNPKCKWCNRPSTKLCDYWVSSDGRPGRTCDAPMCDEHAVRVGPEKDHCPEHVKAEELAQRAAERAQ